MASFDKLTRANMLKYMKEEMDEPQHKDSVKKPKAETEEEKHKKVIEKRNKQFEMDKKVLPKRHGSDDSDA